MSIYPAACEEAVRARRLLKEWTSEGLLTKEQHQSLEKETVSIGAGSGLRTTNIFLRLVLFLFTLISVGAANALFFTVFFSQPSELTGGLFYLLFAAICYAAAETAVSRGRLYRHGIEEALAVCSVGFSYGGLEGILFKSTFYLTKQHGILFVMPAAGAVFSLWIWRRFGLWYAFPAAMIFAMFVPGYWISSHAAQHAIIATVYALGLICIAAVRHRHRNEALDAVYSLAEAFLWLGVYLAVNLKISTLDFREIALLWRGAVPISYAFARPFYWATWVLTWCLPVVALARGIRRKDRYVIVVGTIVAIVTFATNKPYLGWPRHTWDPMLLGILLAGAALLIRRWLVRGPNGIRYGFTAARVSGKDKQWMDAGSAVLGLVTPQSFTPGAQTTNPDVQFGGGSSGGGGASGDF